MPQTSKKTIAFSVGQFFGHITRAVRTDVRSEPAPKRTRIQTRDVQTPMGMVTLRRTVIDEVLAPRTVAPAGAVGAVKRPATENA